MRLVRYFLCHLNVWNFHCVIVVYHPSASVRFKYIEVLNCRGSILKLYVLVLDRYICGFSQFSWEIFVCNWDRRYHLAYLCMECLKPQSIRKASTCGMTGRTAPASKVQLILLRFCCIKASTSFVPSTGLKKQLNDHWKLEVLKDLHYSCHLRVIFNSYLQKLVLTRILIDNFLLRCD